MKWATWNRIATLTCGLVMASCGRTPNTTKPVYGAWGFDSAGEDRATNPGDDFFRFANGAWLDRMQIAPDKSGVSLRQMMSDRTEAYLHEMMEQASAHAQHQPSDLEGKMGAFYKSFMDEGRVEQLGAKPITAELDQVRAAKTRDDLAALSGRSRSDYQGTLFAFSVRADLKDPSHYAFYVNQGGLGLPDRDYFLNPEFAEKKRNYQDYAAQLLALIDWPKAASRAKDVVEFETQIAAASWTRAQQRDVVAMYNAVPLAELSRLAPGFGWAGFLKNADLSKFEYVVVGETTAFPKLAAIWARTPVETLRAWHAVHIADNAAPFLSKSFADAYFQMHDKVLAGQKEQQVRWKRGVNAVSGGDFLVGNRLGTFGTLGFGVGQLYTAKYFGTEAKAKIEALVVNLKKAYRARLEKLDWMGPQTKAEALKKLDTYTIKVGYPDNSRDYSKLVIIDDDVVGNVRRAAAADWEFYSGRLDGLVDKSDWAMTPQTNDAYSGLLRDIVFPAGILQPPIFDAHADPAVNYGAIGGVIGHELTHGFDDAGRKIDASGALRNWWTKEDDVKFKALATKLGEQYSQFEPLPGVKVNGDLTMGENIADLGGLTLGLDAYHASLGGSPAPVIDGLTGDQRVLLGWAQAWRGKATDDAVRKQVVSNPHSPQQFRVNGVVRNLDAWYEAFGVKAGHRLYLVPEARVRIW
jgi:putative endopeptidase